MNQGNINIKTVIDYWTTSAQHDYTTMLSLFKSKRFSACLFFGHLVLEKSLKALVVQDTREHAPYTHDLLVLYQNVKTIKLTAEENDLLDEVNRFNIRARYPDFKLRFYKLCTLEYTKPYLQKIKRLYKKLCQQIKQKN